MEEMKLKNTPNQLLRRVKSCEHQSNRVQPHDTITRIKLEEKEKEQQWQETIDPLKLVLGKVIGRGTFGVVHKGSYNGQTVAVKVLDFGNKGATKDLMETKKNEFIKEVSLWQDLDHPNVTKMIGATLSMQLNSRHKNKKLKTESSLCMVSEYIKGGSLRSYLHKNRGKKLPMKTVFQFAIDIAKGLCYLHSKKIIHRDVKPDNILIDKQNKIKLTDFGESTFESSVMLYIDGEIGTRGYMAPEVVSGKPYGHKCDVYSFGICLWEIYCCEMAYTFDLHNIPANIYKEMRPSIPGSCPRFLASLMERCWDTEPKKRPEMKDIVVELEEIVNSDGRLTFSQDHSGVYSCFGLFSRVK